MKANIIKSLDRISAFVFIYIIYQGIKIDANIDNIILAFIGLIIVQIGVIRLYTKGAYDD